MPFLLNKRAVTPTKPETYEGIRLYWAPSDIRETRKRLKRLSYKVSERSQKGTTGKFFPTDDDGFSHCFEV